MKLTTRGIGWLIAGGIICASVTEAYGIPANLSTIALGLVFVAVYIIKQFFTPRGIGGFIAGRVLIASAVEEGLTSDGGIAVGIAAACLMVFYFINKNDIDTNIDEITLEYYPDEEENAEAVDPYDMPDYADYGSDPAGSSSSESSADDVVEFEFEQSGSERSESEVR